MAPNWGKVFAKSISDKDFTPKQIKNIHNSIRRPTTQVF